MAATAEQLNRARIAFLNWLHINNPKLYDAAMRQVAKPMPARLAGLDGAFSTVLDTSTVFPPGSGGAASGPGGSWWDSLAGAVTALGGAFTSVKGQYDLTRLNLERAKQGQEPLTASQAGTLPQVGVTVGTDRATAAGIGAGLALPIIGLAAVAFVMLRRKSR